MYKAGMYARQVDEELRREKYFTKKAKRKVCILDNKMQCINCKYQNMCEDCEVKE